MKAKVIALVSLSALVLGLLAVPSLGVEPAAVNLPSALSRPAPAPVRAVAPEGSELALQDCGHLEPNEDFAQASPIGPGTVSYTHLTLPTTPYV